MIRHCERSTRRLSPKVSVALSRMPSSNCQSASEAFSISSNNRIESFNFSVCHSVQCFLAHSCGCPMSQVSRRRVNQLRDLVRVLKFGAVNLDTGLGIAKQRLGHGFYHPRLARSRRSKKQKVPDRAAGRIQSSQEHLVNFGDLLDGRAPITILRRRARPTPRRIAAPRRIQRCIESGFHYLPLTGSPPH